MNWNDPLPSLLLPLSLVALISISCCYGHWRARRLERQGNNLNTSKATNVGPAPLDPSLAPSHSHQHSPNASENSDATAVAPDQRSLRTTIPDQQQPKDTLSLLSDDHRTFLVVDSNGRRHIQQSCVCHSSQFNCLALSPSSLRNNNCLNSRLNHTLTLFRYPSQNSSYRNTKLPP
ncbi:hypothetical protein BCR33DRAFT_716939, partial [Rhizoclosmatium globosum]